MIELQPKKMIKEDKDGHCRCTQCDSILRPYYEEVGFGNDGGPSRVDLVGFKKCNHKKEENE